MTLTEITMKMEEVFFCFLPIPISDTDRCGRCPMFTDAKMDIENQKQTLLKCCKVPKLTFFVKITILLSFLYVVLCKPVKLTDLRRHQSVTSLLFEAALASIYL